MITAHNDDNISMMKSIVYGQPTVQSQLKAIPSPNPKQALIRVFAAGLNPVDAKGVFGDKLPHSWTILRRMLENTIVGNTIGFEFSGEVVHCPSRAYQPGDEVYGTMPPFSGTLSEYICAPLDQMNCKPVELTHEQAACSVLVGLTALQALRPELNEDSSILVVGASGGTGHVGIQVSKCLGASTIVGLCSTRNADFVKSIGATHVVTYDSDDFVEELRKLGPFDVIYDCVTSGDPRDIQWEYPKTLLHLCKQRYLRLGGKSFDWCKAGCEKLGLNCFGKEKLFWVRFPNSSEELKQLCDWSNENKLTPVVDKIVEFTPNEIQDAFDRINSRRVKGKLAVGVYKKTSQEEG